MTAEIGDPAPDFTLTDHNRRQVTLSQFRGSKNVVLSFFVFAFTDGWTSQISEFREYNSKFMEMNTQVLGISCDSRATLAAYTLSLGPSLSYPISLLSDFHPHGEMIRSYGLFDEEKGTSFRAVVIVDRDGIIRFRRRYTSVSRPGPTAQGIIESDLSVEDILGEVRKLKKSDAQ